PAPTMDDGVRREPRPREQIPSTRIQSPVSQPSRAGTSPAPTMDDGVRRGISQRAVLAGLAGVVVVAAAGGITLAVVSHSSSPSTGQTTGGTGATILAQDNFQRGNQNGWG